MPPFKEFDSRARRFSVSTHSFKKNPKKGAYCEECGSDLNLIESGNSIKFKCSSKECTTHKGLSRYDILKNENN